MFNFSGVFLLKTISNSHNFLPVDAPIFLATAIGRRRHAPPRNTLIDKSNGCKTHGFGLIHCAENGKVCMWFCIYAKVNSTFSLFLLFLSTDHIPLHFKVVFRSICLKSVSLISAGEKLRWPSGKVFASQAGGRRIGPHHSHLFNLVVLYL